jgi:hypothetical protein
MAHILFSAIQVLLSQLMKIVMLLNGEKTNYLSGYQEEIISPQIASGICRFGHFLPSLVISILIGVKELPAIWPYYAIELDKNGSIVPVAIFLLFIPVAIFNGLIIERFLNLINPAYRNYKNSLKEI